MFNLVEESKDDVIGLSSNVITIAPDPRKGSPLKGEDPKSSVIQMVEPAFPLQSDFDFTKLNKGVTNEMHNHQMK